MIIHRHCENLADDATDTALAVLTCLEMAALVVLSSAVDESLRDVAFIIAMGGGGTLPCFWIFLCVRLYRGHRKVIEGELRTELQVALLKRVILRQLMHETCHRISD
jgi:hypothetical protein